MEKVTKEMLIGVVAEKVGVSKKDVKSVVDTFLAEVKNNVANGKKVELAYFGQFEPRDRAARTGRNPQTGETIMIAPTKVPAFKASKTFKDEVK